MEKWNLTFLTLLYNTKKHWELVFTPVSNAFIAVIQKNVLFSFYKGRLADQLQLERVRYRHSSVG